MAKMPFDIKYRPQIESGEYKVVTRSGKSVRIICWDKVGKYPIVFLAMPDKESFENVLTCSISGRIGVNDCGGDLFLVSAEPELSEWQALISGCLQKYGLLDCGAADRIAKECSAELFELARNQLIEEHYTSDPRKTDLYKLGKAEALKDLPRWKKCGEDTGQTILYKCFCKGQNYLEMDGYRIMLSDLEKLPKEETK